MEGKFKALCVTIVSIFIVESGLVLVGIGYSKNQSYKMETKIQELENKVVIIQNKNDELVHKTIFLENEMKSTIEEKRIAELEKEVNDNIGSRLYINEERLKVIEGWGKLGRMEEGGSIVFGADSWRTERFPVDIIYLDKELSLIEQLQILGDALSNAVFSGAPIEVESIKEINNKTVGLVNLKDGIGKNKNWEADYFGGTCGGQITSISLLETFLQREYKGEWIDGVIFTYNGEKIVSDHAARLGEINFK